MSEVIAGKGKGWAITSDDAGGEVVLRLRPLQTDPTSIVYLDDEDAHLLWGDGTDPLWENSTLQELLSLALAGMAATPGETP